VGVIRWFATALLVTGVLIVWFALSLTAQAQASEHFFQLKREESVSFSSVQFYHLISPSGIAVLSVDGDVPLAQTLRGLEGQRVKLTLENATLVLQKVER
jgi:hypothetical protein